MTTDVIFTDTDTLYRVSGVFNQQTEAYVNDAVVTLTLLDDADVEVGGQPGGWPLTLDYIAESDGDYRGTVSDAITAVAGTTGTAVVEIDGDGLQTTLRLPVSYEERDQASLPWSSREELDATFGHSNIDMWADIENEENAGHIRARVMDAIDEATADARDRLTGLVDVSSIRAAPRPLRKAVTRMAGVNLYESRGVKDTADEEGRHKLLHHKKAADLYFRQIAAGQRTLGAASGKTHPFAVKDAEDADGDLDYTLDMT
jgi:hypothetical protein